MPESESDNVRVAVRVRPLLSKEKLSGEQKCVKVLKDKHQVLVGKDRLFTFDHVISPQEKQESVYTKCINSLVTSCLEGYNATVFAYGQTGSGKTHTIGGTSDATHTEEELGIIPRALRQLFCGIESNPQVDYQVSVSYLELYLEDLRDLLDLNTSSKDITIREDDQGNTIVSGMREVPCRTIDEVLYCLQHGSAARQTGSTQMNEHSSRSHSVFTVTLEQQWKAEQLAENCEDGSMSEQYHYMCGKFHFVDLAGSERAHRTGNVGDRFKESIHINTGLLALGNVISALGDPKKKASHIPYRDSKITRMLKDSLGGNSKTLMICCISPAATDFDETLNALKYANRARNIKNKPVVNRDMQSMKFEEMQNEIEALRKELQKREDTMIAPDSASTEMRNLQNQVTNLSEECKQYKTLLNSAREMLANIDKDVLSSSLQLSVREWITQWDKMRDFLGPLATSPEEESVSEKIQAELNQCLDLLKKDEEIFNEKAKQLANYQRENAQLVSDRYSLVAELETTQKTCDELNEVMLEQQLKIEQLNLALKSEQDELMTSSPGSARRARSVPAGGSGDRLPEPVERVVHTSPALFSQERVMQGFRARSQLLVERLEDEDEVLHQHFADNSDDEEIIDIGSVGSPRKLSAEKRKTGRTLSFGDVIIREQPEDYDEGLADVKISMDQHQREIRQAKLKSQEFNSRLRDLTIAIRMKEQLIRQLVKNEKDSAEIAKQHQDKINKLEEERNATTKELNDLQREFQKVEAREKLESSSKKKLQGEYKKKIEMAKKRLNILQNKQKETAKLAGMGVQNDEKIKDLHLAISKMRQQQEELGKKLKLEHEKKEKLEKDMTKEQQRVKELENITVQQQKMLKIKTEEAAAATRKLRKGSAHGHPNGNSNVTINTEESKLSDQKAWLDNEMEKILVQRKQMDDLRKDLLQREEIVSKREAILQEKGQVELRHLRSSQILSQSDGSGLDVNSLQQELSSAQKQRQAIDKKLYDQGILTSEDERKLLQLDEEIEALDAAIEFKNELILSKEAEIRRSQILFQTEDNLMNRLKSLNVREAQNLLAKYFDKVIQLKESARDSDSHTRQLDMQLDEQNQVVAEMESAIESMSSDLDRQLTEQQQSYEQQINTLLQKLNEKNHEESNIQLLNKVKLLEKDLYYYKKTSRDLKKKLREVMLRLGDQAAGIQGDINIEESNEPYQDETAGYEVASSYGRPQQGALSPAVRASYTSADGQHVKISRKDLRCMSQEEVQLRRSQSAHHQSGVSVRTSADSLDDDL